MSEFKPVTLSKEKIWEYWDGPQNRFGRYYIYWQRGIGLFNEAKNYLALALASFWTIKAAQLFGHTINYWTAGLIVLIAGSIGIPILLLMGRWDLLKLSRVREFIATMKGTVTGYDGFNMQVKIVEQNEQIIELLKQLNEREPY